ncbi:MAG TPA: hypothetical protein VGJ28_23690 [Micromonosporaceae bacterium]|jgi:hypothetical protein
MWGIVGYAPEPLSAANEVYARHGERLGRLIDRRLTGATGLAFRDDGSWSHAGPVLLDFDGLRLEVLAEGFDTLYVSWNSIDATRPIEQDEDPDLALDWSALALDEIGAILTDVHILETFVRLVPEDGDPIEAWLLAGFEFEFADGREVQLVNGLDSLRLASEPVDSPDWRRRPGH